MNQIDPHPHSIEAEQCLLGAILLNNQAYDRVSDIVRIEHFYDPLHQQLFEVMSTMIGLGKAVTPVLLAPYFVDAPPVSDDLTVRQYLGRLATYAASVHGAADYARTIAELAAKRALFMVGQDLINRACSGSGTAEEMIEGAEQSLYAVAEKGKEAEEVTLATGLIGVIEAANIAYQRGGGLSGMSTGFVDLDRALNGLHPGNLVVLAGRPSMGKTALATEIGFNVARKFASTGGTEGAPVAFYSMEMSQDELSLRVLSSQSAVPMGKIKTGQMTEGEFRHIANISQHIANTPLIIDPKGGLTISQLAARARRAKRKHGIGLLIVDYIQLMSGNGREGRVQEVTQITMGLKALAKDLNIPVIALSQLSRQVESRDDKRPQLSDLRESGSIEQDADVVLFVFREEYYVERKRPPDDDDMAQLEWQQKLAACAGKADVIIGKQRQGATNTISMAFNGALTKFSNLARV